MEAAVSTAVAPSRRKRRPYAHKGKPGVGTLGTRLKAERIRRGFQVEEFADLVGVPPTRITGAENRGVIPSLQTIIAMAQVLECSIDYLAGLED